MERRWLFEKVFDWLSLWCGLHCERVGRLDFAKGRLASVANSRPPRASTTQLEMSRLKQALRTSTTGWGRITFRPRDASSQIAYDNNDCRGKFVDW